MENPITADQLEYIRNIKSKLSEVKDDYLRYTQALMLFGDTDPQSWDRAYTITSAFIQKYTAEGSDPQKQYFREQQAILDRARRGASPEAVQARRALYVRGATLDLLRIYERPDAFAWDVARVKLVRLGEESIMLLVDTLLQKLMNEAQSAHWEHYRTELVKIGKPVLEPVVLVVLTLGEHSGPDHRCTPPGSSERCPLKGIKTKITQCLLVLIAFEDWPAATSKESVLNDILRSKHLRVREAFAEALGTLGEKTGMPGQEPDPKAVEYLLSYLDPLSQDAVLEVRMTSALSLGKIHAEKSGALLLNYLSRETDDTVLFTAIRSLGYLKSKPAVPHLIRMLEGRRSAAIQGVCMSALASIVGQDIGEGRPQRWADWWAKEGRKKDK